MKPSMIAVVKENFDFGQDSPLSLNLFSIEVQEEKGERETKRETHIEGQRQEEKNRPQTKKGVFSTVP